MKFLLIYDTEGWAFHSWAKGIRAHHGTNHDVQILSHGKFSKLTDFARSRYDAILHFNWYEAPIVNGTKNVAMVAHHGYQFPYTTNPWRICEDWRLLAATRGRNIETAKQCFPRFDGLLACNRMVESDLKKNWHRNVFYAAPGVDHELFAPQPRDPDGKLRVGWCAQHNDNFPNNKGWRLLQMIRESLSGHKNIEFVVNTRGHRDAIPQSSMPGWYRQLDLFLVTAVSEGAPMPALEAMACGVPVIGTRVGVLPEMPADTCEYWSLPPSSIGKIWAKHASSGMSTRISSLSAERFRVEDRASQARQEIETNWTWQHRAPAYIKALEAVCNDKKPHSC